MTLILTVNGPETIWLLADRRLSSGHRVVRDDARKIIFLETTDGTAILGYAGLGATALGIEPADWMSAVLRSRNLPLEQSLAALSEALKKQFPPHMLRIRSTGGRLGHDVLVSAFLGKEPRLYTIGLLFAVDRQSYAFRYTRLAVERPGLAIPMTLPIAVAGSGTQYLKQTLQKRKWARNLLRIVKAHDRGWVSAYAVADHLASLNNEVHLGTADKSVGPRCIVAWRHRNEGVHNGGGAVQFYTGTMRDNSAVELPTIACGMDINAICRVTAPYIFQKMEEARRVGGLLQVNEDEINAELACLPDTPDEDLR